MHDRQLVIMEELKGVSTEVLSCLTDMRSSGIAEIQKIERRRAHARTRLAMISNPRGNRPVSAYTYGVDMLTELVGAPEDIRRFDFAMIVSSAHVDPKEINILTSERRSVSHKFTNDLSRQLVLFAWTRSEIQIVFEEDVAHSCVMEAIDLCERFTEKFPLVDRGTMKYKIARLAIALAVRTFSTKEDLRTVVVRKCHVEYVVRFLKSQYCDFAFGYDDFTSADVFHEKITEPEDIKKYIFGLKYPRDFAHHILSTEQITATDVGDWAEVEREDAHKIISFLVRKHALIRAGRYYKKTSEFIILLKKMQQEGIPEGVKVNLEDIL